MRRKLEQLSISQTLTCGKFLHVIIRSGQHFIVLPISLFQRLWLATISFDVNARSLEWDCNLVRMHDEQAVNWPSVTYLVKFEGYIRLYTVVHFVASI